MTIIIANDHSVTPVPVNDRCFNYGDGFFTTIACINNQLQLFELHIQRLQRAAKVLNFVGLDWSALKTSLSSLNLKVDCVIKVLVSRGAGGRGYVADGLQADVYITTAPIPSFYTQWRRSGIEVGLSEIRLGTNPLLAGIKHCNRLEQVLIKNALQQHRYQDVVVCDFKGCVVECSASNIFWQTKGQWFTPVIDVAGVDGVMKQYIIEKLVDMGKTRQVKQPIGELLRADSAFICNSLMGIVPIHTLQTGTEQYGLELDAGIELNEQLQQALNAD